MESETKLGVENTDGIPMPLPDTAPKKDEYKEWIKMTNEEMLAAQANGSLMGYHPDKGLGLVNNKIKETKKK